jgi:hypothetical protein
MSEGEYEREVCKQVEWVDRVKYCQLAALGDSGSNFNKVGTVNENQNAYLCRIFQATCLQVLPIRILTSH